MVWELDLNEAVTLKNGSKRVIAKTKRDKAGKERTSHYAWNGVTPRLPAPSSHKTISCNARMRLELPSQGTLTRFFVRRGTVKLHEMSI